MRVFIVLSLLFPCSLAMLQMPQGFQRGNTAVASHQSHLAAVFADYPTIVTVLSQVGIDVRSLATQHAPMLGGMLQEVDRKMGGRLRMALLVTSPGSMCPSQWYHDWGEIASGILTAVSTSASFASYAHMHHAGALMVGGKVAAVASGTLVVTAAAPHLVAGASAAALAMGCYAAGSAVRTIAHGALRDSSVASFSFTLSPLTTVVAIGGEFDFGLEANLALLGLLAFAAAHVHNIAIDKLSAEHGVPVGVSTPSEPSRKSSKRTPSGSPKGTPQTSDDELCNSAQKRNISSRWMQEAMATLVRLGWEEGEVECFLAADDAGKHDLIFHKVKPGDMRTLEISSKALGMLARHASVQ